MVKNKDSTAFASWTQSWHETAVTALLSSRPAPSIVTSVKTALINVLDDATAMEKLWKADGMCDDGQDPPQLYYESMKVAILNACQGEADRGQTRRKANVPTTIAELKECIRTGHQGAGYAILLTAALAFSTCILIGKSSQASPKKMVVQQICEPTSELHLVKHLPCLTIAGYWNRGFENIGHWMGLVPKEQSEAGPSVATAGLVPKEQSEAGPSVATTGLVPKEQSEAGPSVATTGPGHPWSDICRQHPMELTLAYTNSAHPFHENHPFRVATSTGGGLCGDVCMHLVRWAKGGGGVTAWSHLHDLLCAERKFLAELAKQQLPLGSASARWAETCCSLPPIHHPRKGGRIGWRDLEDTDMVVLASSLKVPLVIFRPRVYQQPSTKAAYECIKCHVGLQEEATSMHEWVGVLHSGGTHWELLVAMHDDGNCSILLDETHVPFIKIDEGLMAMQEMDYTKLDPDFATETIVHSAMTMAACDTEEEVWLQDSPRVWCRWYGNMRATSVLTKQWASTDVLVGERLTLPQMKRWLQDVKVSAQFVQAYPGLLNDGDKAQGKKRTRAQRAS